LSYGVKGQIPNPLEPFNPFTFRVLSQEQFDQEIQEGARPFLDIDIPVTIEVTFISVAVAGVAIALYLRRRKKGEG